MSKRKLKWFWFSFSFVGKNQGCCNVEARNKREAIMKVSIIAMIIVFISMGCNKLQVNYSFLPVEGSKSREIFIALGRDYSNTQEGEVFKLSGEYYRSCCGWMYKISKENYDKERSERKCLYEKEVKGGK